MKSSSLATTGGEGPAVTPWASREGQGSFGFSRTYERAARRFGARARRVTQRTKRRSRRLREDGAAVRSAVAAPGQRARPADHPLAPVLDVELQKARLQHVVERQQAG